MSDYSDKLREMINAVDDQVDAIDKNIEQVDAQIEEKQSQQDAIQQGMMDPLVGDMTARLMIKMVQYDGDYIVYGPDFNVTNITDWQIFDSSAFVVYEFEGINWDNDAQIIEYAQQWEWALDYIEQPLGTGGSYGTEDMISKLQSAKTLLQANKNKLEQSKTYFERFAT